jgi:hypothetical protein
MLFYKHTGTRKNVHRNILFPLVKTFGVFEFPLAAGMPNSALAGVSFQADINSSPANK